MLATIFMGMVLLLASPVVAQTAAAPSGAITAADPASIVKALQAAGYRGSIKTNKDGRPYVDSAANGSSFAIDLYNCEDNEKKIGCKTMLFSTWWKPEPHLSVALANRYNSKSMFGRAYINDKSELTLEMPVTTVGGINQANFEDLVDWWGVVDDEMEKLIAEAAKPAAKPVVVTPTSNRSAG
jgi:Putative bacterial sensory transduction regulator